MRCERCKTAEATVHITEIIGDAPEEINKRDLCEACFNQTDLAKKLSGQMADATSCGSTATIISEDEPDR
jgi:protein-arginine kinase activator protein McsA